MQIPMRGGPTLDGSWQGAVRLLYSALCDAHNGANALSGYLTDQLLRSGVTRTKMRASLDCPESHARRSGAEYRGARLADFHHPHRTPLLRRRD